MTLKIGYTTIRKYDYLNLRMGLYSKTGNEHEQTVTQKRQAENNSVYSVCERKTMISKGNKITRIL